MDLFADLAAGCDEHQDKLGVFSRIKHAAKVRIIASEFDDVGRVWFVCTHIIRIPQSVLTEPNDAWMRDMFFGELPLSRPCWRRLSSSRLKSTA